ncbi:MAG: cytochrome c biogenesis protein CcdA, partial [Aurantimicrobium sp.]
MNVGELVYSGQLLVAIPLALLAGLISFASPCVLP